jgi:predicted nucleic acid-binding protein
MAGREETVIDASIAVKLSSYEEGTDATLRLRDEQGLNSKELQIRNANEMRRRIITTYL